VKFIFAAIAALTLAACGTASASTTEIANVRQTEYKALTALTGSHPYTACQYYTVAAHDNCLSGILMAKSIGLPLSALYPSGWQARLAKAKVTITGNQATVSPIMGGKKPTKLAKVDGRWLIA
jgi:hypothetical protein